MQPGDSFFNCIVRLDIKLGEHQVWAEEGTYPGEPIFVPRPSGTAEDDGVLLSVVLAGQTDLDQHSGWPCMIPWPAEHSCCIAVTYSVTCDLVCCF